MPVEAVHLSVFSDSLSQASRFVKDATAGAGRSAARVGTMFVDFPYFERFGLAALRFALGRPQPVSHFGDLLHHNRPIALGRMLGEAGVTLSRAIATREAGQTLLALAMGYICHAAADTVMHPKVNRLAGQLAQKTGRQSSQEHHFIEAVHSLTFHAERFGMPLLGTAKLRAYITIDARFLGQRNLAACVVSDTLRSLHGETPSQAEFASYTSGYLLYCALLGNPLFGPRVCSEQDRLAAKADLYDAFDFPNVYAEAVARSRAYMDALGNYLSDGVFDDSAQKTLAATIPEGSIDPQTQTQASHPSERGDSALRSEQAE